MRLTMSTDAMLRCFSFYNSVPVVGDPHQSGFLILGILIAFDGLLSAADVFLPVPLKTKSKMSLRVMIPTRFLFLTTGKEPILWSLSKPTAVARGVSGRTVKTLWD